MRVTCPACKAVYEAPDAEIGAGGRVVECSACGHRWLETGPEAAPAETPSRVPGLAAAADTLSELKRPAAAETPATPATQLQTQTQTRTPPTPTPTPPAPDAARDAAPAALRRATPRTGAPEPEPQPDPGPAAAPDPGAAAWRPSPTPPAGDDLPPPPAAPRAAPPTPPQTRTRTAAETPAETEAEAENARRRNRVAAIDAQSLSAELRGAGYDDGEDEAEDERPRSGAGFALGFLTALLIAGFGTVAYLFPAAIGDAWPEAWPWLDRWGDVVDRGRESVRDLGGALRGVLSPLVDRVR